MRAKATTVLVMAAAVVAAAAGCKNQSRDLQPAPGTAALSSGVVVSQLRPGGIPSGQGASIADYMENAYAINEGERLYNSYNCVGCHAHGGGAIGPPLMDARWIYGAEPANIFATIVEGRPNGMPSFRGKIPDFQVAELVAYVRSMSGLAGKIEAPARDDHMAVKPAENTLDPEIPVRQEGSRLQ
jgi:cytochrome c oxidase cbb3-type subunit 3